MYGTQEYQLQETLEEVQSRSTANSPGEHTAYEFARWHTFLMACEKPILAYRAATGGPIRFGKMPQDGQLWWPLNLPCGECLLCREEQARQWAVRIAHEATLWPISSFVTLTYSEEHLPDDCSLNYSHLQRFWKRLRHHVGALRYYAVGEYGDKTKRPHYHACIFGHAFLEQRRLLRQQPTILWTSPLLEEVWGLGNVSVGALTYESARYTAQYVTKKLRSRQKYYSPDLVTGELKALVQPRAFMSKRPAIGAEWLEEFGERVYDHDRVIINGRPQKPPKYYDRWLAKQENGEKRVEQLKKNRMRNAKDFDAKTAHARAENARARAKRQKKSV